MVLGVADDGPVIILNKVQIIRVDLPAEAGPNETGGPPACRDSNPSACDSSTASNSTGPIRSKGRWVGSGSSDLPQCTHRLRSAVQGPAHLHLLQKRFISRIIPRK